MNNWIYVDIDNNYYLNGIKSNSFKSIYFVLDGYILKQETENKYLLCLDETLIKQLDHTYMFNTYSEDGCYYYEKLRYDPSDNNIKKDIYYHNFKDSTKTRFAVDFIGNFQVIVNNNAITIKNISTLRSLSLLTGEYDWEVDLELYLPNEDYIKTIYGVVGNGLWLTSYWGVLICIDILSGTIVHLLNYENVDYKTPNVGTMYAQSLFDEHNKKLIGVYKKQYWEIDLQNPPLAMQTYDLTEYNSDYFKDEWHNPEGMKFDEDYIYFRDVERSTIGILNRNTKIIDWHNKLRDVEPRPVDIINDIQITKNKIYTLLTDGTLFVFEKDEIVNV
jgi:hypothetical protein